MCRCKAQHYRLKGNLSYPVLGTTGRHLSYKSPKWSIPFAETPTRIYYVYIWVRSFHSVQPNNQLYSIHDTGPVFIKLLKVIWDTLQYLHG